jgi:hypothetical protein
MSSVAIIHQELVYLQQILVINPDYLLNLNMHSCLTIAVENLHAVAHFKDETMTMLQYARNLGNTVLEGLKRVVSWSAYYYTQSKSYYPVPAHRMNISAIGQLTYLRADNNLTNEQKVQMLEWVNEYGSCVRQRSVRQETTKYKAGTLPLNMYKQDHVIPAERLVLPVEDNENEMQQLNEDDDEIQGNDNLVINDIESEYDTDSGEEGVQEEAELPADLSFLAGRISRTGRIIKANTRYTV